MSDSRIAVTGIGIVSPIGIGREVFWRACLEGRSGAIHLRNPWITTTEIATRIAAPIRHFDPVASGIVKKDVPHLDRTSMFALVAASESIEDAGLRLVPRDDDASRPTIEGLDPTRVATVVGSGIGGFSTLETTHAAWRESRRAAAVKRYALPMLIPNAAAGSVAIRLGARGECKAVSTACAAGTMAIGDACRLLRGGDADVVVAGGTEGLAGDGDGFAIAGFERLKTLSRRNDEPERASRPFDRDRDGFVLGEGAAIFVLERESHAAARGARPYAFVSGYASNCDAGSMLQLEESGESIVGLVRAALRSASRGVDEVEHVSPHGTSTVLNDKTEAKAFRKLFGSRCDDLAVTALKSMTGHAVAGSGPMEFATLALGLRHGVIPPTLNYETPDPECDLDIVARAPRDKRPRLAIKTSYGFGGHNACLVVEAV